MRSCRVFCVLVVLFLFAVPMMAQRSRPLPNWGTVDPITYVVGAWEFQPGLGTEATLVRMNGFQRGGGTPGGYYYAHVHLPSGAKVAGLEITGCDNSATTEIAAEFWEALPDGSVNHTGFVSSGLAATGCSYYTAGLINFNINNLNFTYGVDVTLGDPIGNTFSNVRIYYVLDVSPAPAVARFTDVPTSHPFFRFIEALAASGITAGCTANPPQYCPDAFLTRGQMAVFLARAFGLHWAY